MMVPLEMAAEYETMIQLLKKKDAELRDAQAKLHADEIQRSEKLKDAEECARQVQMDMKVERDKLALTVKELEDSDGQNGLRLAQYKARFAVQDERIVDMGQQLDSLYTAFTMLKEEFDSENERRTAMMSNLNDADAEIARQTNKMEKEQEKAEGRPQPAAAGSTSNASPTAAHGSNASVEESVPQFISTSPDVGDRRYSVVAMAPVSPATPAREYHDSATSDYANMYGAPYVDETPTTYATARSFQPSPKRTPSTWELLLPNGREQSGTNSARSEAAWRSHQSAAENEIQNQQDQDPDHPYQLISGSLIVENNNMLRRWKTKPSKIYLRGQGYQWEIGHKRSFPLEFGISKVEFHPNYPLAFVVYLDPSSETAPVIRAAAVNERDYHRWIAALYKATSGVEYQGGPETPTIASPSSAVSSPRSRRMQQSNGGSGRRLANNRFSHLMSPLSQSGRSMQSAPVAEDREDTDLQRVLELSKHET